MGVKFRYFGEGDWYRVTIHGWEGNMTHKDWADDQLKGLYSYSYNMHFDECRWCFKHRIDAIRFALTWT